jgi:hypothetical protein
MASPAGVSGVPPAVNTNSLIRIKVATPGKTFKIKLPLSDLVPSTLPAKLRELIGVPDDQACTFERYSDSSNSFVNVDASNLQAYKTLYRAAKAKLRLLIRATVPQPESDNPNPITVTPPQAENRDVKDLNQSLLDFAKMTLGSTSTLASTLASSNGPVAGEVTFPASSPGPVKTQDTVPAVNILPYITRASGTKTDSQEVKTEETGTALNDAKPFPGIIRPRTGQEPNVETRTTFVAGTPLKDSLPFAGIIRPRIEESVAKVNSVFTTADQLHRRHGGQVRCFETGIALEDTLPRAGILRPRMDHVMKTEEMGTPLKDTLPRPGIIRPRFDHESKTFETGVELEDTLPYPGILRPRIEEADKNDASASPVANRLSHKYPTFTHYADKTSVRTSGIAAPLHNATFTWSVYCNNCDTNMLNEHYHCNICDEGDFDVCATCKNQGIHCRNENHWLIKRFLDSRGYVISSTTETVGPKVKEELTMPGAFTEEKKIEETEAPTRTCNSCIKSFTEEVFVHCKECEDYDLCVPCLRDGRHGHHPGHTFKPVLESMTLTKDLSDNCNAGRNIVHEAIATSVSTARIGTIAPTALLGPVCTTQATGLSRFMIQSRPPRLCTARSITTFTAMDHCASSRLVMSEAFATSASFAMTSTFVPIARRLPRISTTRRTPS